MARNRMIVKETAEDPKIGKLSDSAKWLFIQLWILADDEGLLKNEPEWIKIKVWAYESNKKVEPFLKEILDLGLIEIKNDIIHIKNFLKHQRIDKPQKSKLLDIFKSVSKKGRDQSEKGLDQSSLKEVNRSKEKLNEVNIKEYNIKELAVKEATALLPQQEVYEIFAKKYLEMSNQTYKPDKKDFICLADLIKKTSKEQVIQKIEIFERACKVSAVSEKYIWWFVKDGISAFTIGNFVVNYNKIMPFMTDKEKEERLWQIEDEKRRQKFEAEQLKKQGGVNVH